MAKQSNIVGQTFEICLPSKMFYCLATSINLASPTFFACIKNFKNITPQILLTSAGPAIFDRLAAFQTLLVKHFFWFYCNNLQHFGNIS